MNLLDASRNPQITSCQRHLICRLLVERDLSGLTRRDCDAVKDHEIPFHCLENEAPDRGNICLASDCSGPLRRRDPECGIRLSRPRSVIQRWRCASAGARPKAGSRPAPANAAVLRRGGSRNPVTREVVVQHAELATSIPMRPIDGSDDEISSVGNTVLRQRNSSAGPSDRRCILA